MNDANAPTVFYAWQDTCDKKSNRNFIKDALGRAILDLKEEAQIEESPRLDHDTKNIPGSPVIAETIFEKIRRCSAFVADLTFMEFPASRYRFGRTLERSRLAESLLPRKTPNPNVLIGLGYAYGTIGEQRIVCVMNEAYGAAEHLAFDLRHRRWPSRYNLPRGTSDTNGEIRRNLADGLRSALRAVIANTKIHSVDLRDQRLANAVENIIRRLLAVALVPFVESRAPGRSLQDVFVTAHPILAESGLPSSQPFEELVMVFTAEAILGESNTSVGKQVLSWAKWFTICLQEVADSCGELLRRYANRSQKLVQVVEDLESSARNMAFMFRGLDEHNALRIHFLNSGFSQQQLDFLTCFFQQVVAARHVEKEFQAWEFPSVPPSSN